jgi:glyoxylase-like metal-dependent hydrolase (beta-lactamase superfamily II)
MNTSRREFLSASVSAAILLMLGRPSLLRGSLWRAQEPAFTAIRRTVGFFTLRGGTIGYLVNPGGVAVVDSQFPDQAKEFLHGLNGRSGARPVDFLINTHHHGDHSGGNVAFRGTARKVVAHVTADEHMRRPPGGEPPADQLYPDTTFAETWSTDIGDERISARHYGRAHTSGDAVVTFERANVVHMGDLVFIRRHPVVDRAAGASIRNWMTVLERSVADHASDTIYIFGHANTGFPVTGDHRDLLHFRDYFEALLAFVTAQIEAGHAREEILAMREPLEGFESFGPFGRHNPRDALTCAYEEVAASLADAAAWHPSRE